MLQEPKLPLPKEEDFFFDDDVDEKWALKHYLGKDINEASILYFQLDPLSKAQDFDLVGITAFNYYIFGAFRYLQDPRSRNEPDVFSALPEILLSRSDEYVHPIANYVVTFSDWAIENYVKFKVSEHIYGDVKSKWINVKTVFKNIRDENA